MNNEEKDTQEESQIFNHTNEQVETQNDIHSSLPKEGFTLVSVYNCFRHPIKTVERWNTNKASWLFLIIAACALGIDRMLTESYLKSFGEQFEYSFILFLAFIGGPISGLISLFVGSALLFLVGKIFRGKATFNQVFNVYVLASFPLLFTLPIWLLEIGIFGENLFKEVLFTTIESLQQIPLFLGFSFLEVLITAWYMLVLIITYCHVNQFKIMKIVFLIGTCIYLAMTLIFFYNSSYELFSVYKERDVSEQEEQNDKSSDYEESSNAELISQSGRVNNDLSLDEVIELVDLGNSYYDSGQYEEALDAYLKAGEIEVTDDTANVYYNIGITYYELENYTESIQNFKQYLEFVPDDLDAYWYMVQAFGQIGNERLEFEYLDKIIELDPSFDALLYKGDSLLYYGHFEEASTVYEEIIDVFPQYPEGYYGNARVLSMHNHPEDAVSHLQKAFEIDSTFTESALDDPYFHPIRETQVFKDFISNIPTSTNDTN